MPRLLALHGNNLNAQYSAPFWASAVKEGWRTFLLHSLQIINPFACVWDDLELGAQEIKIHYEGLTASDSPAAGSTVVGGFSKGSEMAIWLALKETIPMAGFIAINLGGPYIRDLDKLLPLFEACQSLFERLSPPFRVLISRIGFYEMWVTVIYKTTVT